MKDKFVNIRQVYDILKKVVNNVDISVPERLELQRFRDKLTDSEQFSTEVHKQFYHKFTTEQLDELKFKIQEQNKISLDGGFWLTHKGRGWTLMHFTDVYLESLDSKTAMNIAKDINVAIRIKLSQDERDDMF